MFTTFRSGESVWITNAMYCYSHKATIISVGDMARVVLENGIRLKMPYETLVQWAENQIDEEYDLPF